ncbi:ferritin-like domain-containing protein [Methylobacillus flagellatus]|uniref:ferritin-like domain-containing protein n=1 Tax=Methylobacillus flagellatus TaxID=405 RepID=UPI002853A27E|nr:ferritin-like domain-containing protein [Methylobacillus flagellatus]MDR5170978.1 ferritin-like domain-containing protein [Methylobacillus flagellatus]
MTLQAETGSLKGSGQELRRAALALLCLRSSEDKAEAVKALRQSWLAGESSVDPQARLEAAGPIPGRPDKPELVSPLLLERRSMRTAEGRAALIHALAHIEFNAINLALDAVWRFAGMPPQYYADWLKIAAEEALHFTMLHTHLQSLGYRYGDFTGHDSLWEMVAKTSDDVLARMALVPRTLEARGLDASPPLRAKLAQAGDLEAAAILDILLRDEIGHVAIGNRWYGWLCEQRGLEPVSTYARLTTQYQAPKLRGPFNFPARRAAGFSEAELALMGDRHE